jgi:malonate transporter and related proteins
LLTLLSNALLPVFAGLVVGYVAGLRKVVDNHNLRSLITFLMSFALPCSLFAAIARTPHAELFAQRRVTIVLAIVYLLTYAATYFSMRRSNRSSSSDSAVLALTLAFPNATAVGLPLLQSAYGSSAVVLCATAIAIGAVTISPITLAILEGATSAGGSLTPSGRLASALWKAVKRPVVWAPLVGVVAVLLQVHLATYVDRTLTIFGDATAGVALFLTGLIVSAQRFKLDLGVCLSVLAKNIGQPALCLVLARLLSLPIEQTRYVVLISAIPCGFFGVVFGKNYNSTPQTASSSLIASYIVGVFTLAGWIIFLSHLH